MTKPVPTIVQIRRILYDAGATQEEPMRGEEVARRLGASYSKTQKAIYNANADAADAGRSPPIGSRKGKQGGFWLKP